MVLLAIVLLGLGTVLFLTATNRIYRHDDGTSGVMVQCASGFVLLVAAASIGWNAL